MRNFSPAHERRPQGLRTHIDTFPMMAFSGSSAKKLARHRAFSGSSAKKFARHGPFAAVPRKTPPSTGLSVAHPRKNSPGIGLSVAHPRNNSPSTPENSIFRPFWACRANFFALTPIPGRAGRTFSHIARDEGNFETTNTFARHTARPLETSNTFARHTARPLETSNTFAGHAARPLETDNTFAGHAARPLETDNTFAGSKWPNNGLSSLAKAMTVSFCCKEVLAKVLSVS